MTNRQIEVLGVIARAFVNSLGMQAENMQRQSQGYSMAYNDDAFFEQADTIQGAIDVLTSEAKLESGEKR